MLWLQLKIQTTREYVDVISAMLNLFGAKSVTLLDAADQPLLEPAPGETPIWQSDWIVGLFDQPIDIEQVKQFLIAQYGNQALLNYFSEPLADADWERAWLANFQPMHFGNHLWICPSAYEPPDPEAINIILDPGLAFGTGTHPTTALCLEWLAQHPPRNQMVVDYGCGSGILAIAALKLGAAAVWAIDYDEQALEATQMNAKRNQIDSSRLKIIQPEALPDRQIDLLMANILANPLIELAPTFADGIKPGGKLILSGILIEQTKIVSDAYQLAFTLAPPRQKEDWILLECCRILL